MATPHSELSARLMVTECDACPRCNATSDPVPGGWRCRASHEVHYHQGSLQPYDGIPCNPPCTECPVDGWPLPESYKATQADEAADPDEANPDEANPDEAAKPNESTPGCHLPPSFSRERFAQQIRVPRPELAALLRDSILLGSYDISNNSRHRLQRTRSHLMRGLVPPPDTPPSTPTTNIDALD